MSDLNLLEFDKPNSDRIEIGNGYILMVDSRFKDKGNKILIDNNDFSTVQLNGETVNCLYVLGDVPYTPIIAMSGDRVDSITGGQPLSYKDVVYEADGNFSSPDGLCRGTFIVDNVTGEKRMWYGRASVPGDINVHTGSNIFHGNINQLYPTSARSTIFFKYKILSNNVVKITLFGIYKASYGEITYRVRYLDGYGVYGNMNMHLKNSQNREYNVYAQVDMNGNDGKVGSMYHIDSQYCYEDFKINEASQFGYSSAYFRFGLADLIDGEYFERNIYVDKLIFEKNRKYYRGSINCKYDGQISNIPMLSSLNPRGESFYLYIETYGYVDVKTASPVIVSGDINVPGKEGVHATIINSKYQEYWKTQNLNCKMNKILLRLTTVGIEFITADMFINGVKCTTSFAKHKSTDMDIITFFADISGLGSLSNYKTYMIFKENPDFVWTDAYCQEITTNGFPNNRLQAEPTMIKLNRFEETIKVGDTLSVTATVLPANTKNKAIGWRTSDGNVARVNQSGTITAVGIGTAEITAWAYNGIEEIMYVNVQHADITKITSKGLICWLDAHDCDNSSRPTIWKDRSGRGSNGIIKNFTYDNASGFMNGKLYSDGSANQYIDITNEKLPALLGQYKTFTLQVTCNYNDTGKIIQYGRGSNMYQLWFGNNYISASSALSDTAYKLNAVQNSRNTMTIVKSSETELVIYMNNTSKVCSVSSIVGDSQNETAHNRILSIFNPDVVGELAYAGELYSLRLYCRALDEFEIAKNHEYEMTIQREV